MLHQLLCTSVFACWLSALVYAVHRRRPFISAMIGLAQCQTYCGVVARRVIMRAAHRSMMTALTSVHANSAAQIIHSRTHQVRLSHQHTRHRTSRTAVPPPPPRSCLTSKNQLCSRSRHTASHPPSLQHLQTAPGLPAVVPDNCCTLWVGRDPISAGGCCARNPVSTGVRSGRTRCL